MGGTRYLNLVTDTYMSMASNLQFNIYFISATLNIFYAGTLDCPTANKIYDPTTYLCVATCTPGTTANMSNICISCSPACATCNSTNSTNCTTCNPGTFRTGADCSCTGAYF
jgi:hypothetical protein